MEIINSMNKIIDEKPSPQDADAFLEWLISRSQLDYSDIYQSYNGWFNNRNKPTSGSTGIVIKLNLFSSLILVL